MSPIATLSSSPPNHFHLHVSPPRNRIILENDPIEVLDLALSRLQAAGVKLIEWRDLVYRRMNVPASIKVCARLQFTHRPESVQDYSYLVPDALVAQASQVLTDLGLPLSPPTELDTAVYGDFATCGHFHRLTRYTSSARVQHFVIYPQSFATLFDSELETMKPSHTTSSRCSTVLVPTAPAVYASLLRMMLRYDQFDPTMPELHSQLSELIGYHLLGLLDGHVDGDDDDEWERWNVDGRIVDAVHRVRSWGVDQVWRDGEEWIGDALAEVVRTGHIEHLPHKPRTP